MFEDDQLDAVFELLIRIAEATVTTIGPNVEAVVHDLRDHERTLIGIAGNLTDRKVGAPIPDSQYLPENINKLEGDLLNCKMRTKSGKHLISSEVFLRNKKNEVIGVFGINLDIEGLRKARDLLNEILQVHESQQTEELETFASSPAEYIDIALRRAEKEIGKPISSLRGPEKSAVVGILDRLGVFRFRQAADQVAEALLISRASVYSHLKKNRS